MANPNNSGINAPRQNIGSLQVPGINPRIPARNEPFDMAGAVNKMLGGVTNIAGQFADRTAQQKALDDREQAKRDAQAAKQEKQLEAALRVDMAPTLMGYDYSKIVLQEKETAVDAVRRTLAQEPWYQVLPAKLQGDAFQHIGTQFMHRMEDQAKETIKLGTLDEANKMGVMLSDPAQIDTAIALLPDYLKHTRPIIGDVQALAPFVNAAEAAGARGDPATIAKLQKALSDNGKVDVYERTLAQANTQVKQNETAAQKEIADQQKAYIDNFGNYVAEMKLNSDTADMPQVDRRKVADNLRVEIGKSQLEPTKKETMVDGVNRWELNNGTVNWQVVNDIRMDTDRSAATQQPNPTLLERAAQLYNDGGFGKGKAGAQMYQDTMRRIQSTTFDVRLRFSEPAMSWFKTEFKPAESSLNSKMNYMVNQEVRKRIADNPNMSESDITRMAWSRATLYKNMVESQPTTLEDQLDFEGESKSLTPRVKTKAEADALPSGTRFYDPNGFLRTKP